MNSILFLKDKLFIIFLSFHFIQSLNSTLYFDYPYYITLSNDNIFLIHYEGIDIYDSSFNKINQIIQFSGDEEMTKEIFSNIKIKYDNEYILSIINDKIYIFNNDGKFLYKSEDKINDTQTIQSYAITSIGLYNDTYKYVIGFFDNLIYLNLLLYSYNITENNNTLLDINRFEKHYILKTGEYRRFTQRNKDLTCEYLSKYNSYSQGYYDVFTCFFFSLDSIATTNYQIYNNKLVHSNSISSIYSDNDNKDYGSIFIKSETNYNRTLAFISFHFAYKNKTYFTIFNISSNTMKNTFLSENCSIENYKTNIQKFPKSNGLALTYEKNDKIFASLYDNIDNYNGSKSSFEINASCENIKGPAIYYHNNKKNTYFIYYCFKNCSDEFYKNDSYCLNLEKKQRLKKIIICIIIAVIFIILLVISIFIYKRYFKKTEEQRYSNKIEQAKKDEKIMNDILSELIPNDK